MKFKDLLELFKEGKYEDVIKNAILVDDFNAIFLLIRSYIILKNYRSALNTFLTYRDYLESNNFIESIKIYLYLLVKLNAKNSKINEVIDFYRGKQYINQETEEFLCSLEDYVNELKKNNEVKEKYSFEEILASLKSNDANKVASALNELVSNSNYQEVNLPLIIYGILKDRCEMDPIYGMLLDYLIYVDYNSPLLCKNANNYYRINPHNLVIFKNNQNRLLRDGLNFLYSHEKNVTFLNLVSNYLVKGSYLLAPNFLNNNIECASYICSVYEYVNKLLGQNKSNLLNLETYQYFLEKSNIELIENYHLILGKLW